MKQIFYAKLFLLFLFILALGLVACNSDGGSVYNHLQDQDLIKGDGDVLVDNSNTSEDENFIEGGVFEHLEETDFEFDAVENDSLVIEGN